MNDVSNTQLAFGFIKLAAAGNAAKNTGLAADISAIGGKTQLLPAAPNPFPTNPKPTKRLAEGPHPDDVKPTNDKGKPTWDPVKAVK